MLRLALVDFAQRAGCDKPALSRRTACVNTWATELLRCDISLP